MIRLADDDLSATKWLIAHWGFWDLPFWTNFCYILAKERSWDLKGRIRKGRITDSLNTDCRILNDKTRTRTEVALTNNQAIIFWPTEKGRKIFKAKNRFLLHFDKYWIKVCLKMHLMVL